jgi:hypothetical protein
MTIHYETIKCNHCGTIQTAKVEHSIPFATWCNHCEPCGNWIGESEWVRVSTLQRNYAVRALEHLKTQHIKSKMFIENGINISDFEIGYSDLLEESIAIILATDETLQERILEDIYQWIAKGMTEVHDEKNTVIVETAANMIDYILNYTNANIATNKRATQQPNF